MRCPSPMSASSALGGQVRPTALSFARYASSAGVAVAIPALLTRAAPAIIGMVSLASQRREGIRFPSFLRGVSKAAGRVRVQRSRDKKNSNKEFRTDPIPALPCVNPGRRGRYRTANRWCVKPGHAVYRVSHGAMASANSQLSRCLASALAAICLAVPARRCLVRPATRWQHIQVQHRYGEHPVVKRNYFNRSHLRGWCLL